MDEFVQPPAAVALWLTCRNAEIDDTDLMARQAQEAIPYLVKVSFSVLRAVHRTSARGHHRQGAAGGWVIK